MPETAMRIEDLCVQFRTETGTVHAVSDLSLQVAAGSTLAVVGESGSGKSATGLAALGLLPPAGSATGHIYLAEQDVLTMSEQELRAVRGRQIALIFQDSLTALSPYSTLGAQIGEAYRLHHRGASTNEARRRAVDMLGRVGIPDPARRARQHPHEFSGGMRQRAMIAMALINQPSVLVADEPTTALDVTVQAQILELLKELQRDFGMAIVLITHDMGVVAQAADDVLVLYAGREAESGGLVDVFEHGAHPYTVGLRAGMPRMDRATGTRLTSIPGTPASGDDVPTGCPFQPRCAYTHLVGERCTTDLPPLELRESHSGGKPHRAACHLAELPELSELGAVT
ncbi:MAG: ABC transporter ATP-binding protein [Nocardioidaceae bacterium]